MKRRLAQLAEESRPFKDDPRAGRPYFEEEQQGSSPTVTNESTRAVIDQLARKIEGAAHKDAEFRARFQRELGQAEIPAYVPRAGRDVAMAAPWTGAEHEHDLAHRMLQDAHKPARKPAAASTNVKMPTFERDRNVQSVSQRLATARDKSLDYESHHKHSTKKKSPLDDEDESGPSFRELYAERFIGVSSFTNNISAIASLATQRIDDAMARGEFDNVPRGQQLARDHNLGSAYIDTTEYFLNRIVKEQGGAPVWIDKQAGLQRRVDGFRAELDASWLRHAVMVLDDAHAGRDTTAKLHAAAEHAAAAAGANTAFRDAAWEAKHAKYHRAALDSINSMIRGYNLQAPSVSRRAALLLDRELAQCYARASPRLVAEMRSFLVPAPPPQPEKVKMTKAAGGAGPIPEAKNVGPGFSMEKTDLLYEEKEDGFLKNRFKELFRTRLF